MNGGVFGGGDSFCLPVPLGVSEFLVPLTRRSSAELLQNCKKAVVNAFEGFEVPNRAILAQSNGRYFMKLNFLILPAICAAVLTPLRAEEVAVLRLEKKGALLPPVVVELFEADAPKHAANFKKLIADGFYQKTAVHRVIPGALVQMGDPLSRKKDSPDLGTGGPGYTLNPEIKLKHGALFVGMGRLPDKINPGRLSNGSQFYITLRPLPELDGTQTVFGKVIRGGEVLEEIGRASVDTNDSPVERISVRSAKLVAREKLEAELTSSKASGSGKGFWSRLVDSLPRVF